MQDGIYQQIEDKINLLETIKKSDYIDMVEQVTSVMIKCLQEGGKLLLAGNGGSAADAQHFAGEVVGRFLKERAALPAISLCVDPSVITCIGNDYGYDEIFARQVQGLGNKGDCFVAISTSGNSSNLIKAVETAKEKGIITIGLLGNDGGSLKDLCDFSMVVPSTETPRIQEIHTFTVHILCENIEKGLFTK